MLYMLSLSRERATSSVARWIALRKASGSSYDPKRTPEQIIDEALKTSQERNDQPGIEKIIRDDQVENFPYEFQASSYIDRKLMQKQEDSKYKEMSNENVKNKSRGIDEKVQILYSEGSDENKKRLKKSFYGSYDGL